jgi:large subunit ribosomal protein L6
MLKNEIEIPDGVSVTLANGKLTVKGKRGEASKVFVNPMLGMSLEGSKIVITSPNERKKVRAIVSTWETLVRNMFKGTDKAWKAELKLVYSHFPIKLKVDKGRLLIDNFLGEKSPRSVPIPSDMKVELDQSLIKVSGHDKERVGQLCGRIEQTTRIRGYDKRIFQDGLYITRKPYLEGEE